MFIPLYSFLGIHLLRVVMGLIDLLHFLFLVL